MLSRFSLLALQNGDVRNILINVVASAIWAVLGVLGWRLTLFLQHLFRVSRPYYRINGTWIGLCKLPRHHGEDQVEVEVEGIEIYQLKKRKENVIFSFFHYRPDTKQIVRYEGTGVYRGELLSAFYYIADSYKAESGVFVLRTVGELFKGFYAQYSSGMKPYHSPEVFILRRIQISFWAQVKMLLHRPPFPGYAKAKELYDAARKEQPDIVAASQVVGSS